jgi:hypothetical protein
MTQANGPDISPSVVSDLVRVGERCDDIEAAMRARGCSLFGDFESYVEHFALDAGDLFDLLFEHIEDAPPRPVREHPQEFVALIARYNRPPAGGYLFSAYPRSETRELTLSAGDAR